MGQGGNAGGRLKSVQLVGSPSTAVVMLPLSFCSRVRHGCLIPPRSLSCSSCFVPVVRLFGLARTLHPPLELFLFCTYCFFSFFCHFLCFVLQSHPYVGNNLLLLVLFFFVVLPLYTSVTVRTHLIRIMYRWIIQIMIY